MGIGGLGWWWWWCCWWSLRHVALQVSEFPLPGNFDLGSMASVTSLALRTVPCNSSGDQRLLLISSSCHQSPLCLPFPSSHPGLSQTIQLFSLSVAAQRPLGTASVVAVLESPRDLDTCLLKSQGTQRLFSHWVPGLARTTHLQTRPLIGGRVLAG